MFILYITSLLAICWSIFLNTNNEMAKVFLLFAFTIPLSTTWVLSIFSLFYEHTEKYERMKNNYLTLEIVSRAYREENLILEDKMRTLKEGE